MKRRTFIEKSTATTLGALIAPRFFNSKKISPLKGNIQPLVVCTWSFDKASAAALKALNDGKTSLEAAVEGVAIEENNPYNTTVGLGGAPDREGTVSLDACVMNHLGNCGAVLAVENIKNVAALAQAVMEKTPHVILTGNGAKNFALEQGFVAGNLLTEESKLNWEKWLKTANYQPVINIENHDTIGMLCLDAQGNLSGSCTTSGLAYKMKGRVGDSPIIGSGLFVDNQVGAATATGLGEAVIKTVGSFLIVELMRNGYSPQNACEEAIQRILSTQEKKPDFQVGFIAINIAGEIGAYSIHQGFSYTYYQEGKAINVPSASVY